MMERMYFRWKKTFDYGLVTGRLYRYGKAHIAIFVTKEEEKDKEVLGGLRKTLKEKVNPCKETRLIHATPAANKIHQHFIEQARKDK